MESGNINKLIDESDLNSLSPEERAQVLKSISDERAEELLGKDLQERSGEIRNLIDQTLDKQMEWDFDIGKEKNVVNNFDFGRLERIPAKFHRQIFDKLMKENEDGVELERDEDILLEGVAKLKIFTPDLAREAIEDDKLMQFTLEFFEFFDDEGRKIIFDHQLENDGLIMLGSNISSLNREQKWQFLEKVLQDEMDWNFYMKENFEEFAKEFGADEVIRLAYKYLKYHKASFLFSKASAELQSEIYAQELSHVDRNGDFDVKPFSWFCEELSKLDPNEMLNRYLDAASGNRLYGVYIDVAGLNDDIKDRIDHNAFFDRVKAELDSPIAVGALNALKNLDHQKVVDLLIERDQLRIIKNHLREFKNIDSRGLYDYLVKKEEFGEILANAELFDCIDYEQLKKLLLEKDEPYYLLKYLERFDGLDPDSLLQRAFKLTNYKTVIDCLYRARKLDVNALILDVYKTNKFYVENGKLIEALSKIEDLSGLNNDTAWVLAMCNQGEFVVENLDAFGPLSQNTALTLIRKSPDNVEFVIGNIDRFEDVDRNTVLDTIIQIGTEKAAEYVIDHKDFFGLNDTEIAAKLTTGADLPILVDNLPKLPGLDIDNFVSQLKESGFLHLFLERLDVIEAHHQGGYRYGARDFLMRILGVDNLDDLEHETLDRVFDSLAIVAEKIGIVKKYVDEERLINFYIKSRNVGALSYGMKDVDPKHHREIALAVLSYDKMNEFVEGAKSLQYKLGFDELKGSKTTTASMHQSSGWQGIFSEEVKQKFGELNNAMTLHEVALAHSMKGEVTKKAIMAVRLECYTDPEKSYLESENQEAFDKMAEVFGAKEIVGFFKDKYQDYLHLLGPQIMRGLELSGMKPKSFWGNILLQIEMDSASYPGNRSSSEHYQAIIDDFKSPDEVFAELEGIELEGVEEVVAVLKREGVFASWKNLRKFGEFISLIQNRRILDLLKDLKKNGNKRLARFVGKLGFHPDISLNSVIDFALRPSAFLEIGDEHAGREHERKKPSNYLDFPHLDITAEDLRDALVDGDLDKIQYFPAYEVQYVSTESVKAFEVSDLLKKALGERQSGKKGEARNVKAVRRKVLELLKKNASTLLGDEVEMGKGYEMRLLRKVVEDPRVLNDKLRNDLVSIIYDKECGLVDNRKREFYRARVHLKSSVEGLLAGNDTACCMKFGSGKNNVYMYNLACAQMTIEKKSTSGYVTIAQSVLTPDLDVDMSVPQLVSKMLSGRGQLHNEIKKDVATKPHIYLTADNIERNLNFGETDLLKEIYADFGSRYAEKLQQQGLDVDQERMIVGQGYAKIRNFDSVENTYVPIIPPSYSDNLHKESYVIDIKDPQLPSGLKVKEEKMLERLEKVQKTDALSKGVRFLTAEDTLRVAYLEGKVYANNESLIQYIHRIGNEMIAKDINNQRKGRPNLSLIYEDKKGTAYGYLLAYEGVDEKSDNPERVIYVSDLAAGGSLRAGGALIKSFMDLLDEQYLQKGEFLPIVAEARESTSYPIIKDTILPRLRSEYGVEYRMEEEGTYTQGDDVMHRIKLVPVGRTEEVAA